MLAASVCATLQTDNLRNARVRCFLADFVNRLPMGVFVRRELNEMQFLPTNCGFIPA